MINSVFLKMKTLIVFYFLALLCTGYAAGKKIDYWNVQRKGANYFNQTPSIDWFIAAKAAGIQFARLAPDKWECEKRDFLVNDADAFTEISYRDLETLKVLCNILKSDSHCLRYLDIENSKLGLNQEKISLFLDSLINIKDLELYQISMLVSTVFQNPKTYFFNVNTTLELLFYLENIGLAREEMDRRLKDMLEIFPD